MASTTPAAPPAPPTLALWLTRALAEATQRDRQPQPQLQSQPQGQGDLDREAGSLPAKEVEAADRGQHHTALDLNQHKDNVKADDVDVEAQPQSDPTDLNRQMVSAAEEHVEASATFVNQSDVDVRDGGEEGTSSPQVEQPQVKEVRMQMHVDVRKKRTEIETEEQRQKSQHDTARWDKLRARRHSTPGRHSSGPQRSAGVTESDDDEEDAVEGDERTPLAPVGPERHKRKRRRRKRHRKPNRNAAASSNASQTATPSRAAPVPTISFSSGMSAQEAGMSAPRRPPPAKPYYDTYPFTVVEETIWQGTTWPAGILSPIFRASTHWFITNKRIDYVMGFGGRIAESVELRRIVELRYERDCIDFMLCGRGTIVIVLDEYSPIEELQISSWGLKKPFQKLRSVWLATRVDQERPIGRLTRDEEDELIRRKLSQAGVVHSAFEDAFAAADDLERAREGSHSDITSSAPPTPASSF